MRFRRAADDPGRQGSSGHDAATDDHTSRPAHPGPSTSERRWTHQTSLAAECASASLAREFVCLHLAEHGLPRLVDDMRLVVSELATNAILHARTPFTVTLAGDDLSVVLTVHDDSCATPVQRRPGTTETGGRGLAIIDRLSDVWGVLDLPGPAKEVWARFATT